MEAMFAGKKVAFCGLLQDEDRVRLTSYLTQCGAKFVVCATNLDFLIVGSDYESRFKYTKLKPRYVLPYHAVLKTIPCELWVDTYTPQSSAKIIGQTTQMELLRAWLLAWPTEDKETPRGALVTGPPGIGKTTAVHLLVAETGYQMIEFNASTERSANAIRRWLEEASRSSCVGPKRVVVMDEVDGMSSGDRGGVAELARYMRTCTFPIICIANDRTPKLRPLSSCCLDIRFVRPTKSVIARALLAGVVKDQRLTVDAAGLETLCERNGNDIRSILNYLQFSSRVGPGSGCGTKDELLRVDAFSATGRLFDMSSKMTLEDRSNLVFVDFGMVPLMVAEGYVGAASRGGGDDTEKLRRICRSADALSDWDIIDSRIHRRQDWSLLPAAVMAIVTTAREAGGPAPFQIFPSWLGKQSKRAKHMRNLRDLSQRSRIAPVMDSLDLLRATLFAPGSATQIVDRLTGLGLTRDDMLETLVDTAFPSWEGAKMIDTKLKGGITREWKKRHVEEDMGNTELELEDVLEEDEEELHML